MNSSLSRDFLDLMRAVGKRLDVPTIREIVVPPRPHHETGDFGIVILEDSSVGFFYVLLGDTLERVQSQLNSHGSPELSPLELIDGVLSEDLGTRALALGAINAISQHVLSRSRCRLESTDSLANFEFEPEDHIGMVGLFPSLAKRLADRGLNFTVIEQRTDLGDAPYRISHEAHDLRSCNKILITASTLVNDTLEDVLEFCIDARVALIGPSAGCLPDPLFARGVHVLGASRAIDIGELPRRLKCGESWSSTVEKYALDHRSYPGFERLLDNITARQDR